MKQVQHRRHLNHLFSFVPFLVCVLLCGFHAGAAEAGTQNKPKLRVGVSPVFPPMVFKQGNELVGVEVDLARALGEHLGREIELVEVPWKNQMDALAEGKTDIIMSSMSITTARRFVVNFTRPYFLVGQMALVRREDKNKYSLGFHLSPSGKMGVIKATTGEFLVQRDFPKNKRKTYDDGDDAAKALIKKRIDMFISDSPLIWYLAGMHAADGLSVVPIMLSEEQLAWAVRKNDDALLASANEFITQAAQDGRLLKVFKRWTAVGD